MDDSMIFRPIDAGNQSRSAVKGACEWDFQWAEQGATDQVAQVSGSLSWRGFDLAFTADGLTGLDGRLAASGLEVASTALRQMVLHHFASQCLKPLQSGPLADMRLQSLQWHEEPRPMEGEFEFLVRRAGFPHFSRGRMALVDPGARMLFLNALASANWPLPSRLAQVDGQLHIGSVRLSPEERDGIEVGDLIWLDGVEPDPRGLKAQFVPTLDGDPSCWVWLKRSFLHWQAHAQSRLDPVDAGHTSDGMLRVASYPITVTRDWLLAGAVPCFLTRSAAAMTWRLCSSDSVLCEGRLMVVGRRLGIRVTAVM